MDMMANPDVVGDMLDFAGFFEADSGATEYYMALEMAADLMRSITEDLEKRFRTLIEKLEIGTNDRPLKTLFHDDKVLCFNLEVAKNTPDAHWYFGCYGINDLENMWHLANVLGIDPIIFRTDGISVTILPESDNKTQVHKPVWKKIQLPDRKWNVQCLEKRISINNRVREYSLETGALIRNQARRDSMSEHYEGEEISILMQLS